MAAVSLPTTSGWPLRMEPVPYGLSGVRGGSVSGFHDSVPSTWPAFKIWASFLSPLSHI